MLKKSCAVALSLVFVLSIVSAIPSFAMENKEPYTKHIISNQKDHEHIITRRQ